MIRKRAAASQAVASNSSLKGNHDRLMHRRSYNCNIPSVLLLCCFLGLLMSWLNERPRTAEAVIDGDTFTIDESAATISYKESAVNKCQVLLEEYNQTRRHRGKYAKLMMKRLEVQPSGCGSQLRKNDPYYYWDHPPADPSNHSDLDVTQQLVHMYYDNVTQDVSFAVASALATKADWRNLRILVWLDPPTYQRWQDEGPPQYFPDCPRHITVLEYNMQHESKDTGLEQRIQKEGLPGKLAIDPVYTTDAVRIILLYKYGGLWVDVDALFVRDYDDLMKLEFPGYRYYGKRTLNGAMMHFHKGGDAVAQMMQLAATENRYGPFDGYSGLTIPFWKQYNEKHGVHIHTFDKNKYELPECLGIGLGCGLRNGCRFFQDMGNRTDWYDSAWFGVNAGQHRIVHTHNECPRAQREYHPNSPFGILLQLYLQAIQHYAYCHV